ncbi:MAG: hypothetical protein GSR86_06740 [Desulfurococcales archaeon]|nr:hypothetical protein [Desulfurococcales archaeon]
MIELPKLKAMEDGWGNPYILTHDFNIQGLSGWEERLGGYEQANIPSYLGIKYHPPVLPKDNDNPYDADTALLMHAEQSAVVLVKRWDVSPGDLVYVRMVSYALATRTDCEGNVSVHAGFYYVSQSVGAVASIGGLTYDSLLPYVIGDGSNWILSTPTGTLEIYSPTGAGGVSVNSISIYKAPKDTYIVGRNPYKPVEDPVKAIVKQANGGIHTVPAQSLDGLVTAIVPGNPLLLTPLKPVKGALLLDLAPGYSRLPARLELYKLVNGSWSKIDETTIVPARGRIGFKVEGEPGEVFMLKSTVTVRIDRIYFSPVNRLDLEALEALKNVSIARIPNGVKVTYDPGGVKGPILLSVDAQVEETPVLYTGGGGLTVYGKLWITNPAGTPYIDECAWVTVSSDVVEVPGGTDIRESGLILIGYRYPGGPDSPLMTLYVKTLLYPVITSAGYPSNVYDIKYHTEAVTGISGSHYQPSLDVYNVYVDVSSLRTSIAGEEYFGDPLEVPDINITSGRIHYENTGGCEPPNDGYIQYSFLTNSVESTNPNGPGSFSGLSTMLSTISVLGSFASIALSIAGYEVPAVVVEVVSLASGLFSGVADVMYGATAASFLQGTELVELPCTHFDGFYVVTDYGYLGDYTHVVMSYTGSYYIQAPSEYGALIGAVVFNHYEHNNPQATDDDAIVVLLYFIKPVGSSVTG